MIAEGGGRGRLIGNLAGLAFASQSAFDLRGLVRALSPNVLELTRADGFALFLVDYETGDTEGDLFERGSSEPVAHARYAPRSNAFLERVLRRETLVVEGAAAAGPEGALWRDGSFESVIGVPVRVGTSLLGVLVLGYRRPVTLTDGRRRALRYLADQIALALDRLKARSEIEAKTRQLEEVRASLQRIDDAKTDLISIVSHELRTPLTAIKAYTETLLDNADAVTFPLHKRFLGIIDEECDRLTRMVNDVLDLSRMDSGRRRLNTVSLSLATLIEEVAPTVEPGLRQRGLRLKLDLEPGLPHLEADPDLLKQVLLNLMHNAVKFSREGSEVTVSTRAHADRIQLAVQDQGPGIAHDQIARVFDRFYRVESDSGERVAGTGLGLAIVKRVVQLHGGAVSVESTVGQGSRFVVDLPREQQGFRALIQSLEPLLVQPELRGLLQVAVEMIAEVMDAGIVSIMFFSEDGAELAIHAAHGLDPDTVARTRVQSGDSIAGWVARTSENLIVADVTTDRRFRKMSHPQYETKSLLCVPLRLAGETVGVVNVTNKRNGLEFDSDDLALLIAVVKRVTTALDRVRADSSRETLEATLRTIRAIVRARQTRLLPGGRRAFKLAVGVGKRLGLTSEDAELLGYAARVHDVGMLEVDDRLLLSSRRWSPEERRDVEGHPQAGVQMLRSIEFGSKVNEIILGHHEHWDGRGYPRGLAGEQIPLAARVLAVVDAWESMIVGRPYREPVPETEALAELRRCAGTQFDPRVVEEFCRVLAEEASAESSRGAALAGGAEVWRPDDALR